MSISCFATIVAKAISSLSCHSTFHKSHGGKNNNLIKEKTGDQTFESVGF